jgi:hypothetical protein
MVIGTSVGLILALFGNIIASMACSETINNSNSSDPASEIIASAIFLIPALLLLFISRNTLFGKFISIPIMILGVIIFLAGLVSKDQALAYFVGGGLVILTGLAMQPFSRMRTW